MTVLDPANPRDAYEIRADLEAWLRDSAAHAFAAMARTQPMEWRNIARAHLRHLPTPERARLLAEEELRRVNRAGLFHIDARTTRRLLREARTITHRRLTPESLPSPTGMAVFAEPIATTGLGDSVIAAVWGVHGASLLLSVYIDVRPLNATAPAGSRIEGSANLCYQNDAEIYLDGRAYPWASNRTTAAVPGEEECEPWLRMLTALWTYMDSPAGRYLPERVGPGKASTRRLAARGITIGHDEPPPVRLVNWRKAPPAPPAPLPAVTAAPKVTGRSWTIDHEFPVDGHTRRIRDENGNVIKEFQVRPHVRGAGLGPKRTRVTLVTDDEGP